MKSEAEDFLQTIMSWTQVFITTLAPSQNDFVTNAGIKRVRNFGS